MSPRGASTSRAPDGGTGFDAVVANGILVSADGARCVARPERAEPYQMDGFVFTATFRCPHRPHHLTVTLPLLDHLPVEHRHLMRLSAGDAAVEATLSRSRTTLEVDVPGPSAAVDSQGNVSRWSTFLAALALGVRHILTGWDHLLFLLGIAFGVPRLRDAILPVTSFTLAHSLTLAAATLGLVSISPRFVEPAIAASVAVVAFADAFHALPKGLWLVTFAFGLIHGLGFAGTLQDLALDRERLIPTLIGFNAGVEVGQIGVLALALPSVLWLTRKRPGLARTVCLAIGVTGVVLCVARLP
jgi:hydrogenase/urease accessory protein HupE